MTERLEANQYKTTQPDRLTPGPQEESDSGGKMVLATFDERSFLGPGRHWHIEAKGSTATLHASYDPPGSDNAPPVVVDIPRDIAKEIQSVMLNVVLDAGYPPVSADVLDGTSYHFGARRFTLNTLLRGSAYAPSEELPPKWLCDLGDAVFENAYKPGRSNDSLRRSVMDAKEKIYSYYRRARP